MTPTTTQLQERKAELLQMVNVLITEKKAKYSNMDIESPMSDNEKSLNKAINDIFSEINSIVREIKRSK